MTIAGRGGEKRGEMQEGVLRDRHQRTAECSRDTMPRPHARGRGPPPTVSLRRQMCDLVKARSLGLFFCVYGSWSLSSQRWLSDLEYLSCYALDTSHIVHSTMLL